MKSLKSNTALTKYVAPNNCGRSGAQVQQLTIFKISKAQQLKIHQDFNFLLLLRNTTNFANFDPSTRTFLQGD
jgi:hypothetical protein